MDITNPEQNITFDNFDKFDRKPFADSLTQAISTFYPFYEESYVLSLNATFGSGKSTFLKMWKHNLEKQGYKVIHINAWKSDFDEDPIIHIVGSLLENIKTGTGLKKTKNALKKVLGASALTTNQLLKHTTGIDVAETIKESEKDTKDLIKIGGEIYNTYNYKEAAYENLKKNLKDYVSKLEKKPLIIFVDELDRVRPNYAIKFLEAIKHIFGIQGICFVLAVDKEQLKVATQQLYGKIDFENYYLRFYTRETNLPSVESRNYHGYIKFLSGHYFDEKRDIGIEFSFNKSDQNEIISFITDICKIFQFRPRQVELLFRIFAQLMAVVQNTDQFVITQYVKATILLIAFYIQNRKLYKELGNSNFNIDEVDSYILSLSYDEELQINARYLVLLFISFSLKTSFKEEDSKHDKLINLALKYDPPREDMPYEESKREIVSRLIRFKNPNGSGEIDRQSGFSFIYDKIEKWENFL
ncbi:MAG: P-loop NTPase fold protein [Alphaproteobacteria bacterium]|nr:P-loop NTPase fold protein [Alphaproteobacteria bacterium]